VAGLVDLGRPRFFAGDPAATWLDLQEGAACFAFADLDLCADGADLAFDVERERLLLGFMVVFSVLLPDSIMPKVSCSTSGADDSSVSSGSSKSFSGEAFSPSIGRGTDQGRLRPTTW
jgi:hypothetical protein